MQIDEQIARQMEAAAEQARAERDTLRPIAERDLAPLRAALEAAQAACAEFSEARNGYGGLAERNEAIALDGRRGAAREALRSAEEAAREAQRRIRELDAQDDPAGAVERARNRFLHLRDDLAAECAKYDALLASIPGLSDRREQAQARAASEREQAEEGAVDAIIAGAAPSLPAKAAKAEQEAAQLVAIEARARGRLAATEARLSELRRDALAARDEFVAASARLAVARGQATLAALGDVLIAYAAGCRVLRQVPALPAFDEVAVGRRVAQIPAALPPLPAIDAAPEAPEVEQDEAGAARAAA